MLSLVALKFYKKYFKEQIQPLRTTAGPRAPALTFNVSTTKFIVGLDEGSLWIIFQISSHEK
jgi:hypothetical protein